MNATEERRHPLADLKCEYCNGSGYCAVECFDQYSGDTYSRVDICVCVTENMEDHGEKA